MRVNITELSDSAQIELLQHFPMETLTGMLRLAGLQGVKTKEIAAANLVKSGKLTYDVDLRAGLVDTPTVSIADKTPAWRTRKSALHDR